jgi:hypothetical protein
MSSHSRRLATRTHGVRPSEKTAFRADLRPFTARPSYLGSSTPRRGGLRTPARKALRQTQYCPPFGHRPLADPWVAMTSPGLRPGRICGRAECVPPRKPPSPSSPAFPRKASPPRLGFAAEGRAPHAREEGIARNPILPPFWPPASRRPVGRDDLPRFASGPYLRTRRPRPSEKIAFRAISGPFPARPPVLAFFPTPALKTP